MKAIIKSLLDTDLYKATMAQVVWRKYPDCEVEYTYKCRNNIKLETLVDKIKEQLQLASKLRFTPEELDYLKGLRFIKPAFVTSFLARYQLNPELVQFNSNPFEIKIKGPWLETIFFEIYLLAIISELHYNETMTAEEIHTAKIGGNQTLTQKIEQINLLNDPTFRVIEFGTRRRFSREWQEHVLKRLIKEIPANLFGTSNIYLAMKYKLKPIGTMAHEYLQAFQALGPRLADSQKAALEAWAQEYRGDLGIALTDVICMDAFLKDFDLFYTKLFDGMRHDSGCPFEWGEKAIAHYKKMGVDPKTKALVFSDGLDIPKAIALHDRFERRIKTSFGIGTNLTNDLPRVIPVNHVIKMTRCNNNPVAKLSDAPGKSMCEDQEYLTYLKRVFNYTL